ncbi:MAG TPA: hypothetical protein PLX97_14690 [Gemmatales bacterium]|nr:hypothetical protein [Gemmatales bacterium]
MIIKESWKVGDKTNKRFIKVYKDGLVAFLNAITGARAFWGTPSKPFSMKNARKKHARAYMAWTTEDDKKLRSHYENDMDIPDLARLFERKRSAIIARLAKLGLKEAR